MTPIDVMMPAFNSAATVTQAIASIQEGNHLDVTIIVVDDGSTDGTGEAVRLLAKRDRRIRYIHQENRGVAAARQRALEATTSEFVSQLDSDDLSDPDRLSILLAYLEDHPDCVAVCGEARQIDTEGRVTGRISKLPPPMNADLAWLPAREPAQLPFAMWRRSAVIRAGGYRSLVYAEDVDLSWRLKEIGTLENLDTIVGSYRVHASSTGASLLNMRILCVETQRAVVSARRRRARQPDLPFDSDLNAAYRKAESLEGICAAASSHLTDAERGELEIGAALKMLQWLEDRKRAPDRSDCRSIRAAYNAAPTITQVNRAEIERSMSVVAGRLIGAGRWRCATVLAPPHLLAVAGVRLVTKRF